MISQSLIDQYQRENLEFKKQIEQRTGKSTEQLYEEREKRVREAIFLQKPDRVPFSFNIDLQAYTGAANSTAYYDPIAFKKAQRKMNFDLEPDMCAVGLPTSGDTLEALDVKNRLWPGCNLPSSYEYQFIEGEYMKEDEYDMFLSDPTGFLIRCYLPRVYGAMAPLAKLPPMDSMFMGLEGLTILLSSPEFLEMAARINRAGQAMRECREAIGDMDEEMAQLGFPGLGSMGLGVGGAPFDTLSSSLRGMKGSMTDMYRQPEKLLKACEVILDRRIARALPADPTKRGNPKRTGIPLWRGDKAFMSEKQFRKFYWPGLKRALQADIDLGLVPIPFFEAEFGDRLECLLELPKGKIVASVEYVDALKATQILKGHSCVMVRAGPLSSRVWSLQQVEKCIKDLFDKVGRDGGVLFNVRLPDTTDTAAVQALLKSIRDYCRY